MAPTERSEIKESNTEVQDQPRKNCRNQSNQLNTYKCIYTNSDNSLLKKNDQLKGIFATQNPQIAGISEIKPKNGTIPPKQLLEIEGYDCFINDCYEDSDTRGVIVYTKQHIKAQLVTNKLCAAYKDSVWIKIPVQNNADMLVGCIYR